MSDKKPDVHKLRKKHRVDELVAALRYPDAMVRTDAATALGEIGDRGSAASVKAFATEITAEAARAGHWDPGETSRLILKAWAAGATKNSDQELRDYAARVSARVESQEAARREALLSGVRQMPPEVDEEIPVGPERGVTTVADATLVAAAALAAGTSQAGIGDLAPVAAAEPAAAEPAQAAEAESATVAAAPAAAPAAIAVSEEPRPEEIAELVAIAADREAAEGVPSPLVTLVGHEGEIGAIALVSGGGRAVSASWDGTMRIWDLETGKSLHVLRGHEPGYLVVAVTPDGQRAVSGSADGTVRVWDLNSGKNIHTLRDHQGTVCDVAVTLDGRGAVSCSSDKTLRLWDMETGGSIRVFEGHEQAVESFTIPSDGLRVISGSRDGTVRVWELASGKALSKLGGHRGERLLAVAADGEIAVTQDDDGTLRAWDLFAGGMAHAYEAGRAVWFSACAVTPDNSQVLVGCWGGDVMLFDLHSGDTLRSLGGHTADVNVIEVSPDGSRAVSGSADRTAAVWHVPTGRRIGLLEGHAGMITALAITPDGQRVITGSSDATLQVWELPPVDDASPSTKPAAADSDG